MLIFDMLNFSCLMKFQNAMISVDCLPKLCKYKLTELVDKAHKNEQGYVIVIIFHT